jgi:hypothetical protein
MMDILEAVSIRLDAISLIKCALDILVPPRFWLENLLSLTWAFQSQILLVSHGLVKKKGTYQILSVSSVIAMMGS